MATPQGGIFDEGSHFHWFLEYDAAPAAGADALRNRIGGALAAGAMEDAPALVVAFGRALAERIGPGLAPPGLRDFQAIDGGPGRRAPATQRDLWFWIHGPHHDRNFERALAVQRALAPVAVLRLEVTGFTYRDSRDLTGFVDGSANPKGEAAREAAFAPAGAPGEGGSFVLTQRWVHDLAGFEALAVADQERVIGRTKRDSVELPGDAMPETSHVSRTDVEEDGVELEIYRRSAPFAGVREHGLYFLAFACDPHRFDIRLQRMFGTSGDGVHDRLTDFSVPTSGSYLFAPSGEALERAFSE